MFEFHHFEPYRIADNLHIKFEKKNIKSIHPTFQTREHVDKQQIIHRTMLQSLSVTLWNMLIEWTKWKHWRLAGWCPEWLHGWYSGMTGWHDEWLRIVECWLFKDLWSINGQIYRFSSYRDAAFSCVKPYCEVSGFPRYWDIKSPLIYQAPPVYIEIIEKG